MNVGQPCYSQENPFLGLNLCMPVARCHAICTIREHHQVSWSTCHKQRRRDFVAILRLDSFSICESLIILESPFVCTTWGMNPTQQRLFIWLIPTVRTATHWSPSEWSMDPQERHGKCRGSWIWTPNKHKVHTWSAGVPSSFLNKKDHIKSQVSRCKRLHILVSTPESKVQRAFFWVPNCEIPSSNPPMPLNKLIIVRGLVSCTFSHVKSEKCHPVTCFASMSVESLKSHPENTFSANLGSTAPGFALDHPTGRPGQNARNAWWWSWRKN